MLTITDANWKIIKKVQTDGNKVIWTSDTENWKRIELWEFPKEVGKKKYEDCDGISLYKMDLLIKQGIPANCLSMTVCKTETGEGHAILCIHTDRGEFYLDNRFSNVASYNDLMAKGYKFIYRSNPEGKLTDPWFKVS